MTAPHLTYDEALELAPGTPVEFLSVLRGVGYRPAVFLSASDVRFAQVAFEAHGAAPDRSTGCGIEYERIRLIASGHQAALRAILLGAPR